MGGIWVASFWNLGDCSTWNNPRLCRGFCPIVPRRTFAPRSGVALPQARLLDLTRHLDLIGVEISNRGLQWVE
jgi:hypothetical protein